MNHNISFFLQMDKGRDVEADEKLFIKFNGGELWPAQVVYWNHYRSFHPYPKKINTPIPVFNYHHDMTPLDENSLRTAMKNASQNSSLMKAIRCSRFKSSI